MNVEKAIWSAYNDTPCRLYSIRELALHLHKSYSLVHQHVSRLILEKKLLSKQMGKSILCYPNFQNQYALLSLAKSQERYLQKKLTNTPSLVFLQEFFSSQIFSGTLAIWMTKEDLVIVLVHKKFQKSIEDFISQTTYKKNIIFKFASESPDLVDLLSKKTIILFGFEYFYLLIREQYELFASKYNLVKLHE